MKAKVYVTLKSGVHDPQGEAVSGSLKRSGLGSIQNVRIGKYIEVELTGAKEQAELHLKEACDKLLANPVIENYRIEM